MRNQCSTTRRNKSSKEKSKIDFETHCPRNFQLAGHMQEDNGEREVARNVNAALGMKSQDTSEVKIETIKVRSIELSYPKHAK